MVVASSTYRAAASTAVALLAALTGCTDKEADGRAA